MGKESCESRCCDGGGCEEGRPEVRKDCGGGSCCLSSGRESCEVAVPLVPSKVSLSDPDEDRLCLAVVRENGADVVVFDAEGTPRSFRCKGVPGKLCFSTHGHAHADDLLTPCFSEDGKHGVPDEGCFCGVETPHLHAHLHNPKTCSDENHFSDNGKNETKKKRGDQDDFWYLAQLSLHPTEEDEAWEDEGTTHGETRFLVNLGISDRLPNECNSQERTRHMEAAHGRGLRYRGRRMHKVQHQDHVDYLVHNSHTGDLHLEHHCDDCGDNDVHGQLRCVSKRRLPSSGSADSKRGELHFFEVAPRPFSIMEHISGLFDTTSGRVLAALTAVEPDKVGLDKLDERDLEAKVSSKSCCADGICTLASSDDMVVLDLPSQEDGGKVVRSCFMSKELCCVSAIPMIGKALEPLAGVAKILINVPVKTMTVDHDPAIVTAQDIEALLNENQFGVCIKQDGAARVQATGDTVGRSQFYVQKICCASEIPAIQSIVNPVAGVFKVSVNATSKMVYVDHDTSVVSAPFICDAMNAESFGAVVKHDAADDILAPLSTFVRSTLSFAESDLSDPDIATLKRHLGSCDHAQLESFVVNVPSKTINIVHNPLLLPIQTIVDQLEERTGIEATILIDGATNTKWDFPEVEDAQDSPDENFALPSIPVILSGIFWAISMLSLIGGNWKYLKYAGLLSVFFGLPPIGMKAYRSLRRYQFDANVLMFVAAAGALALQEFTEAAAVTFLFSISEWLEVRATSRARTALSEIVRLRPDRANLVHPVNKELMLVPASAVPVGALVCVKSGEKIPCDGVVVEGLSTVDESSLTGESRPVRKGPKDKVSGGTINSGHTQLMLRTTATAENSAVARLIRLVEEAQAHRSPTEKLVDEFAKRYTPIVIFAALCMCTIPWAFGKETGKTWLYNGLVLLVVACPCALIISTPVTYVAGLAACAQRGILVKGGAHLEALGMVLKIAFDKTGTLTQGSFALLHLDTLTEHYTRMEVLQWLALMEERASHPLAQAILAGTQKEGISVPKTMVVDNHTLLAGEGVTAQVNGIAVHVGNERLFRRLGLFDCLDLHIKEKTKNWASVGGTVGFMSIDGAGIVCAFCVADAVRPEAPNVVKTLRKSGMQITMLTGDGEEAATAIGNQLGLSRSEIRSQLLPEDKLTLIDEMKNERAKNSSVCSHPCQRHELVLMCGDGVNDAPALAAANVGVAMGAGAALAMETSDVTLLDSQLEKLVYSLRMGKRVIWKIRQNVIFSFVVKAVVVGFTLAGRAHLWAAIATDVGAMLLVTLNGMLLLPSRRNEISLVVPQDMDVQECTEVPEVA